MTPSKWQWARGQAAAPPPPTLPAWPTVSTSTVSIILALPSLWWEGFQVQNAKFEGILVADASRITIVGNRVFNNNKSLIVSPLSCPGLPSFETSENDDCGQGIHLTGVDHSIVAHNIVFGNAGGILISDDTGQTHDNLISDNLVHDNAVRLRDRHGFASPGLHHRFIGASWDRSQHACEQRVGAQRLQSPKSGSGIGIFTPVPGGTVTGNVIVNNKIENNGQPGVAMHSHGPGQFLNDNVIVGNHISGNGADAGDAATPGTAGINVFGVSPITGTIISQNTIQDEAFDIVVNTPTQVDAHLNNFLDNTVGVDNIGAGTSNAVVNWWDAPADPGRRDVPASVDPECSSPPG